jgi:hypothetical protein
MSETIKLNLLEIDLQMGVFRFPIILESTSMNDYFIYLTVPEFLACYITSIYGNPVQLPKDSVESRIVKELLRKLPCYVNPDHEKGSNLIVQIPQFDFPDPRVYNWMSAPGKTILQESFFELLWKNFYKEMESFEKLDCQINLCIIEFMDRHNLPQNSFDMFQKRYYRWKKRKVGKYQIKR